MSHEASSIHDFIRPGGGLIVVKLDRLGRNTLDVPNLESSESVGRPGSRLILVHLMSVTRGSTERA
jgi:hypothetical protein